MKHARADYDRIQDPAGLIPDDEPVLLIRGQDRHAARIARFYADVLDEADGDPELIRLARDHAQRMEDWPVHKSPDL